MATLESVLLAMLVVDAIALTILVLVQQGKGADVGAAFGSGSSNTMFGSLGAASFLTKATAWLAIGFFVITFALAYTAKERAAAAGNLGIPTVDELQQPESIEVEAPDSDGLSSDIPSLESVLDDVPEGDVPASEVPELDLPSDVPAVEPGSDG